MARIEGTKIISQARYVGLGRRLRSAMVFLAKHRQVVANSLQPVQDGGGNHQMGHVLLPSLPARVNLVRVLPGGARTVLIDGPLADEIIQDRWLITKSGQVLTKVRQGIYLRCQRLHLDV